MNRLFRFIAVPGNADRVIPRVGWAIPALTVPMILYLIVAMLLR